MCHLLNVTILLHLHFFFLFVLPGLCFNSYAKGLANILNTSYNEEESQEIIYEPGNLPC